MLLDRLPQEIFSIGSHRRAQSILGKTRELLDPEIDSRLQDVEIIRIKGRGAGGPKLNPKRKLSRRIGSRIDRSGTSPPHFGTPLLEDVSHRVGGLPSIRIFQGEFEKGVEGLLREGALRLPERMRPLQLRRNRTGRSGEQDHERMPDSKEPERLSNRSVHGSTRGRPRMADQLGPADGFLSFSPRYPS